MDRNHDVRYYIYDYLFYRKHFKRFERYKDNLSHLLYFITMTLLALPTDIIQLIGDQLDDAGLNALTQAHRHMHQLLMSIYHRDVIKPHSRSLA
jgi:hypothetical protein